IVDTFFSPTKVFDTFREGPAPWLGPVLVNVAVLVALTALRPLFITDLELAEFALQKMGEMGAQELPPAEEMAKGMMLQTVVGTAFAAVWLFLRVFVMGAVLAAVFGLLMGGRTQLRPYAAVASHAFLVSALGYVVVTALQYATGRLDVVLDATLLMGEEPGAVLTAVGRALSPFGLWVIALMALGGAAVNRRRGWLGAAAILFALQLALMVAMGLAGELIAAKASGG
ncbi:MAG TPA: YIP1 family protein, partial [Longimicrobium sp.]|nr:YIP1 family protein [Longimicrobium sp.]